MLGEEKKRVLTGSRPIVSFYVNSGALRGQIGHAVNVLGRGHAYRD